MRDILAMILLGVGTIFMFLAAIGVLRMPDVYQRMSATTKVATMGVGSALFAAAFHFDELGITVRAVATVGFILLTAPVAAHMIARAAYVAGVPLWEGTITDELKGRYDPSTHELASTAAHPSTAKASEEDLTAGAEFD